MTGFVSHAQVGTPLSGVTGSTRLWVVPVSDHRWSCALICNERARSLSAECFCCGYLKCCYFDSINPIFHEGYRRIFRTKFMQGRSWHQICAVHQNQLTPKESGESGREMQCVQALCEQRSCAGPRHEPGHVKTLTVAAGRGPSPAERSRRACAGTLRPLSNSCPWRSCAVFHRPLVHSGPGAASIGLWRGR